MFVQLISTVLLTDEATKTFGLEGKRIFLLYARFVVVN
jgi:hypothetical protein